MGTPARNPRIVHFADYVLDLQTAELSRNGKKVILQEQPFQILTTLIESQGRLVTREELIKRLWASGTFVDYDQSLNKAVARLREALGDHAEDPQFVETFPRKGYRFVVPIKHSVDPISLAVVPLRKEEEGGAYPNPQLVEAPPRAPSTSRIVKASAIALSILVCAFVVWTVAVRFNASRMPSPTTPFRSLAVLPLENLSGDAEQDYFADGMTDQLITNLGQIHSLRVISRTSAMEYRGVHKSLPQVARELQVDAIIEGTVLRSGGKVRITAQLIQAREDRHLWAQSFEGDLKDVLVLQDNISRAIASQVQMALLPGQHVRAGIDRPLNMEAYESYLKGEYYLNRFSGESIKQALEYFQQAVEKDPGYAPAYAKMSGCYRILANMNMLPKRESDEKARALVAKALELDPNFGAAHAGKGWGLLLYDLNFAAAGDEFKRAVELSPNSVEAHQGLGDYYAAVGRLEEAVHEVERARELDPLASIVNHDLCQTLTFARRWDEALAQCKANLELDPNSARTLSVITDIYTAKGMEAEALSSLMRGLKMTGASPEMIGAAEAGTSRGGFRGCWKALIPYALDGLRKGGIDAFNVAVVYTRAGDADNAILWLQKAVNGRSFGISFLGVDPAFDRLRPDPRFLSLLQDIGLTKHSHSN